MIQQFCAASIVTNSMSCRKIICGMWSAASKRKNMIYRQKGPFNFKPTQMTNPIIPYRDRQTRDTVNLSTGNACPPGSGIVGDTLSILSFPSLNSSFHKLRVLSLPFLSIFAKSPPVHQVIGSVLCKQLISVRRSITGTSTFLRFRICQALSSLRCSGLSWIAPVMGFSLRADTLNVSLVVSLLFEAHLLSVAASPIGVLRPLTKLAARLHSRCGGTATIESVKGLFFMTTGAMFHFGRSLDLSIMRLTSSETVIPKRLASAFKNFICGTVKEIICLYIPIVYPQISNHCKHSKRQSDEDGDHHTVIYA